MMWLCKLHAVYFNVLSGDFTNSYIPVNLVSSNIYSYLSEELTTICMYMPSVCWHSYKHFGIVHMTSTVALMKERFN